MVQNNNFNHNSAKIYTGSSCGELRVSTPYSKSVISATNNRARYFSELSEKYKEEARMYKEEAKAYAEKNADVTVENLEELEDSLLKEIAKKQSIGDYAIKSELPKNVSELNNDAKYVVSSELDAVVEDLCLPEQEGNSGKVLCTNGVEPSWIGVNSFGFVSQDSMVEIPCVVETYVNGTSWYRVWSDGWCEQGGRFDYGSLVKDNIGKIVNLLKPFSNTTYTITGSAVRDDISAGNNGLCAVTVGFFAQTKTSFYLRWYSTANEIARYAYWTACGYIN